MRIFFTTLTGHMTIAALFLFIFIVPLLFGGVLYLVQLNYENEFIDHVRNDAYLLATINQTTGERFKKLESELKEAQVSGRIEFYRIVDNEDYLIRENQRVRQAFSFEEDFFFGDTSDNLYHITVPLFDSSSERIGELQLGYNEKPTLEKIYENYRNGLYLMLGFIGVTFSISVLLGNQIAKPIHQLSKASKRIAQGDYDAVLQVQTKIAEIADLAESLDFMRHELVNKSNEMQYQAQHDNLTTLPNRVLLQKRVEDALHGARGHDNNMAFLLIDLDRFKEVNDTLGHLTGDMVLKLAAERIHSCVRDTDTAARLGGDEFALLLPATSGGSAEAIAQLVSKRLQENFAIDNHKLSLGASIGIALYPEHGDTYEKILHCADIAMYAAKRKGRETITWHPELEPTKK